MSKTQDASGALMNSSGLSVQVCAFPPFALRRMGHPRLWLPQQKQILRCAQDAVPCGLVSALQLAACELDAVEAAEQGHGDRFRLEELVGHGQYLVFGDGFDLVEDLLHAEEVVEVHLLARQVRH